MNTAQLDNSEVSRHLGQTSSYARDYDSSLLVREPRQGNREYLNLKDDDLPFCGYDIWNAYEVSSMTKKGCPVTAVAKIMYPCDNSYIVESKSLKLYLNSFNMTRFGDTRKECLDCIQDTVEYDLSELLNTNVVVSLFKTVNTESANHVPYYDSGYTTIEDASSIDNIKFTKFSESPDLLTVTSPAGYRVEQKFHSSLLKSNCRVTKQPDWGDVYIYMRGTSPICPTDLIKYVVSFRDECHFHEEICECFYTRLWDAYKPDQLAVTCLYVRRGGIDINPTRASHVDLLNDRLIDPDIPFAKTCRQ